MDSKYSALFTPWKIGSVEIKNRIVLCPMGGTSLFGCTEMGGCRFDKEAAKFLLERAKNNVGLVISGIAPLRDPLFGRWLWQNERVFDELKIFVDELHQTGAKIFIQLTAGMGRAWPISDQLLTIHSNGLLQFLSKPVINTEYQMASPSSLPSRWPPHIMTRAISKKEINKIIDAFAKTAALCKQAGVDGVEVHGVHEGYLMDQFTLKYTNFRTDEYGGSFENRYRFPVEVVQAIKIRCGRNFPVSLRYSVRSMVNEFCISAVPGENFREMGRDLKESEKAARYLQDAGYDMLNADNGTVDSWYWSHPPKYMPQNCNLEDVAHIRQFVDIPVVCAGRMDPEVGAQAIAEGRIDAVGIARQFLADPEWITKLIQDRIEDIRPCICCHAGCFNSTLHKGSANTQSIPDSRSVTRCALNPSIMQSEKYKLTPVKKRKCIAVIGGGIGGMEAALVCAKRGHKVTIYEKTNQLGGIYRAAASLSFKEKDRALLDWYIRELDKYEITIHTKRIVEEVASMTRMYDEVIVATGAVPNRLKVKGMQYGITATEFLQGSKPVGQTVAVIGGGLTGCEIAYELYLQGKTPIIVEMKDALIADPGVWPSNSSYLRDFFNSHKVAVHLDTKLTEIFPDGITVENKHGSFNIRADSVILSVGYRPSPQFPRSSRVHHVGDCSKVGNLRSVIWQAWDVAMKL